MSELIASRLQELIESRGLSCLPSLRELSKQLGVSVTTVRAAAHQLKSRGVIRVRHGARMRVGSDEQGPLRVPEHTPVHSPAEALYRSFRDRIQDGTYLIGKALPKVAYQALESGVSHHTVTCAYRRLAAENLAHKRGRTWFSGPRSVQNPVVNVLANPVVLLLQDRESTWSTLASRPFYESFCRSFHNEVESHGIHLIPVVYDETAPSVGVIGAGRAATTELIHQLGDRYRGALVMNITAENPSFPNWVFDLASADHPLVWFDRSKLRPDLGVSPKHLIRCRPSEENGVSIALELLTTLGHRCIAYPYNSDAGWVANREELLVRKAQTFPFPVSIVSSPYRKDPFLDDDESGQARLLRRWHRHGLPHVKGSIGFLLDQIPELLESVPESVRAAHKIDNYRGVASFLHYMVRNEQQGTQVFRKHQFLPWLISLTPTLAPYLRNSDVTAIIAPNDSAARSYLLWLRAAAVAVPRDISLISFDNFWVLQYWPITTVDFGFGYLGYCAFHAILGDIPLKRNRDGDIPAQPRIIHRGTVGPPRQGAVRADLRGEI